MKKHKEFKLPKISADNIAKQLKRGVGEVRAVQIANYYAKNLGFHPKSQDPVVKVDDVDPTLINRKDVIKNAHIWTQVHRILQKG